MTLPVPEPVVDPELLPFWEGTARGELLLRRCTACGTVAWPPRTFCPACSAAEPEWFAAAGTGEVYSYTEAGNGELGFYLVSDGSGTPWRVRIRPPCFPITQGLSELINGAMLSDIVPTFGSLNMIGGECDH